MPNKTKIVVTFILLLLGFIVFANNGVRYNIYVLLLSYAILTLSTFQVFSNKGLPFSLHKITNLFFFFFIGLAPVLQFKKDVFFMGVNGRLSDKDFIFGNIIFLSILVVYTFFYRFFIKGKDKGLPIKNKFKLYSGDYSNKLIFSISLLSVIALFLFFDFNFEAIFSRKNFKIQSEQHNKSILSIINVFRCVPLLMLLFYKFKGKKNLALELTLLALIIVSNFPIGIPRYKVAVIFLPLCLVYFKPFFKKEYFTYFFIAGFMVVFPYLHHFRYNSKILVNPLDMNMFTGLHFDSYQNSLNIITNNIITYGEQLKGAVLFFIPKQVWVNKPIGSSYVLANTLEYDGFSNVAIGFFAEGFINFGFLGILLFVLILAKLNAYLDARFWMSVKSKSYFTVLYLIALPFEFFILRGSLKAPFANLCGCLFFTVIVYLLLRKVARTKIK